ncbi:MAG: M20/M25/M40 family metallo-hydrolase [Evtepia sp.]
MEHIQSAIRAYFDARQEELIQAVCRLVRIDSTLGPAAPGQPFGPGPAAALDELVALAREWGLTAQNLEGYVGAVDLNDRETELHILGHLDVVDPGEGWTVTSAFEPKLVDGLLYGRGTDDDKGPVLAALMAMRAVKDLGFSLKKNVRLIAGTDEETGFRDIHWYYERHPYAPHTLSPTQISPSSTSRRGTISRPSGPLGPRRRRFPASRPLPADPG